MWRYVLKRLLLVVPTLLGISVITFCLVRLAPGDPATAALGMEDAGAYGRAVTQRLVESARRFYGLDKPLLLNLDVKDRRRTVLSMWEEARALLMKTGGEDPGPRSAASRERFRALTFHLCMKPWRRTTIFSESFRSTRRRQKSCTPRSSPHSKKRLFRRVFPSLSFRSSTIESPSRSCAAVHGNAGFARARLNSAPLSITSGKRCPSL